MRPLVVVAADDGIEPRLLLQDICGDRLGRFPLQRQMHPIVATVSLLMARPGSARSESRAGATRDSLLNRYSAAGDAKGTPLSVCMAAGRPNSLKTRSNTVNAKHSCVVDNASQVSK